MRNPNGYGTVYKLSGNRRRPYVAAVTTGWTSTGKRLYKPIGYYSTQPEANKALADYNDAPTDKLHITFAELYTEWKSIKWDSISKSTRDGYKAAYDHLEPLHKLKFKDVRTAHIRKAMKEARTIPRKEGDERFPLSKSSLEKMKALCTLLYGYAMEHDIVNKNYAALLNLSEIPRSEQTREIDAFSDIELDKIEKGAANGVTNADIILILCYTGFRINEFLPLDIFDYHEKESYFIGGLKTEAGKNRIVPIHPKIIPYIKRRIAAAGDTIFCDEDGKSYKINYFRERVYYPALEALGVRKLSPHCCRHTCASIMDKNGVDKKAQQLILGHTKYEMTAKYNHREIEFLCDAIKAIS